MNCEKCNLEITFGDWPFCPHGKVSHNVITDEIPGGILIRHGLCNEDGTPRMYYSKSEIAAEAKRRGLVNRVEHITGRDTDKSPHTVRWTAIPVFRTEEERKRDMAQFLGLTYEQYVEKFQ